ncbi:hypothetical protein RRG08_044940 [Elysia crispata]|uniref:Uncharacterized protein n=1 Tax=Elysia crispata TaxID=231223 RepID=A0AAE0ZTH6_9GAST|nr:hypothetical protein RRG08_044940 [Elysia crispata]
MGGYSVLYRIGMSFPEPSTSTARTHVLCEGYIVDQKVRISLTLAATTAVKNPPIVIHIHLPEDCQRQLWGNFHQQSQEKTCQWTNIEAGSYDRYTTLKFLLETKNNVETV